MYCTRCGSVVTEGGAFCRNCGQAVATSTLTPAGSQAATPAPEYATEIGDSTLAVSAPYLPPGAPASPAFIAPYAGFWLRVVAYLIDSAILTVAFVILVAISVAFLGVRVFRGFGVGSLDRSASPFFPMAALGALVVLLPITLAATWLYFALMESSVHQATLGKMALGLFVTDLQGRPVSFGRATGRFFAKIITGLIPFFIGYLMAGFTQKKQALHDMIASCLVLKRV